MGIGVFLFWYVAYPHAMSYQEQYQLFLWTWDYFIDKISLPGGFADWVGEFIVQFYYVEWLGALLLSLLFVTMQRLTVRLLQNHGPVPLILSLVPVGVLMWVMGDINVMLALPVAVVIALGLGCVRRFRPPQTPPRSAFLRPLRGTSATLRDVERPLGSAKNSGGERKNRISGRICGFFS